MFKVYMYLVLMVISVVVVVVIDLVKVIDVQVIIVLCEVCVMVKLDFGQVLVVVSVEIFEVVMMQVKCLVEVVDVGGDGGICIIEVEEVKLIMWVEMVMFQVCGYVLMVIVVVMLLMLVKECLQKDFQICECFIEVWVDQVIKDECEYLLCFIESGWLMGGMLCIEVGDCMVQVVDMLDVFFDLVYKNYWYVCSI